jgi:alkanesulfonate monooxygenase SsuD/methylene tetrahydromethanopterin reductase-like flavin-dependent oxidoreductase (luciferase family)
VSRTAAFLSPGRSLERTQTLVGLAEQLGYELVLDNHIAGRDGLTTLAAYGRTTSTIGLGTGVYPMLQLSPVALAQLAASIDELIDNRLVLGIGTSHRPIVENWHGRAFPASPVSAMRDTVTILRALFTTGHVSHRGGELSAEFAFAGFTPRPDIPIHIAALGPRMLELAGELADGVILWLCDPDYIRDVVVPRVTAGAERAGRDPASIEIIPAVTCCVTDEPAVAYDAQRRALQPYLGLPFYRSMLTDAGFADELAAFDAAATAGDAAGMLAAASDRLIDRLAGIGSAEQVRATIARYRDAGATLPAVGPLHVDGARGVDATLIAAISDTEAA